MLNIVSCCSPCTNIKIYIYEQSVILHVISYDLQISRTLSPIMASGSSISALRLETARVQIVAYTKTDTVLIGFTRAVQVAVIRIYFPGLNLHYFPLLICLLFLLRRNRTPKQPYISRIFLFIILNQINMMNFLRAYHCTSALMLIELFQQ